MTLEQQEFAISQYVTGGELSVEDRAAVKQAVAGDAASAEILAAEQRLNELFKSMPAPDVNYHAFLAKVSAAVASEPASADIRRVGWARAFRLIGSPVRAASAAVIIACGIAIPMVMRSTSVGQSPVASSTSIHPLLIQHIDGPLTNVPQIASGSVPVEAGDARVAIGPATATDASATPHFAVAPADQPRPGRVEIGSPTTQETSAGPF